jgi:hypothetical protein
MADDSKSWNGQDGTIMHISVRSLIETSFLLEICSQPNSELSESFLFASILRLHLNARKQDDSLGKGIICLANTVAMTTQAHFLIQFQYFLVAP